MKRICRLLFAAASHPTGRFQPASDDTTSGAGRDRHALLRFFEEISTSADAD
jgi:hypothetical protein